MSAKHIEVISDSEGCVVVRFRIRMDRRDTTESFFLNRQDAEILRARLSAVLDRATTIGRTE